MNPHDLARTWAPTLPPATAAAAPMSVEERKRMAKNGMAMPDGSFPIPDEEHLRSAIRLARTPEQRRHVIKRARALGKADLIPDTWREDAAMMEMKDARDHLEGKMGQMASMMEEMMGMVRDMHRKMGGDTSGPAD